MITITTDEILQFAPSQYKSFIATPCIHQKIYNSLITTSTSNLQEEKTSTEINVDELIIDTENLPQVDKEREDVYQSDEVKRYLESQMVHRLKFLKEVKERGLAFKGFRSNEKGGNSSGNSSELNKFMNY
ncbi:hypothetical protein KGF56_004146 [Candida oxycetoniae]|uniref:Uncharacterized protein n=1 Tax=Candida oxycetoniae TaxID=497107 RepID=A0AAI9SUE8_9ASCO|nr:uncharacterized protein KGF56_004146 [Candida oxycetoniae]KAI3403086.2 hypothetical protein KGF56_004146 [Candida oxycetoniae]